MKKLLSSLSLSALFILSTVTLAQAGRPGYIDGSLTVNGNLKVTGTSTVSGGVSASSITTDITAFAGGGQSSATALTKQTNNVTVCATAGDSVKLPVAVAGSIVTVKNSGATALDVFPAASDSIDALAINLAVRIQPGSQVTFFAKDAIVWESNIDETFTLSAPATVKGQLVLKAANSAGNTVTTITNASQSGTRVYTVPDAGASASFAMTEGAQTINGIKTFGSGIAAPAGSVGTPGVQVGTTNKGLYEVSTNQLGVSVAGQLDNVFSTAGLSTVGVKPYADPGTANTGVSASTFGDGKNFTTILTVSQVDAVTVADAAALADGYLLYTLPAGPIAIGYSYMTMAVTLAEDTTATLDGGLGTLLASAAQATLDADNAACENILTGQTFANASGTAKVKTVVNQPLAIETADSHAIYFNIADTWANTAGADLTGDIAGTVTIHWTKLN